MSPRKQETARVRETRVPRGAPPRKVPSRSCTKVAMPKSHKEIQGKWHHWSKKRKSKRKGKRKEQKSQRPVSVKAQEGQKSRSEIAYSSVWGGKVGHAAISSRARRPHTAERGGRHRTRARRPHKQRLGVGHAGIQGLEGPIGREGGKAQDKGTKAP